MSGDIADTLRHAQSSVFEKSSVAELSLHKLEQIKKVAIDQQSKNNDITRKSRVLPLKDQEELLNQSYLRLSQNSQERKEQ